ncbi:helix-turn-helix transcriptional regulator [Nonomuraea sp. NPDC026600]|uniref:helix-turn-helix domain-containing protein n=1 Tax=Nonomuraea sp. NPDC026600 TaxID=3155363 RepID=UPI0033F477EC
MGESNHASGLLSTVTSPAEKARQALGLRLRALRTDAGLLGNGLASLAGWQPSKVSRIERGLQKVSESDLRAWCKHCDAPSGELESLTAALRNVDQMYSELRRNVASLKRFQEVFAVIWRDATSFRIYEPGLVPGIFQTRDYAQEVLKTAGTRLGLTDHEAAADARVARQDVLYRGAKRFVAVIEEQALRTKVGDRGVMLGQLDKLMNLSALSNVSLGIIPRGAERLAWWSEGFWIYDSRQVMVETRTAQLTITQPAEVAVYAEIFDRLQQSSLRGEPARELIREAIGAI